MLRNFIVTAFTRPTAGVDSEEFTTLYVTADTMLAAAENVQGRLYPQFDGTLFVRNVHTSGVSRYRVDTVTRKLYSV